ncbi:MAG: TauD/TfdA family dioxygenase [Saccharopolyspora sp.]|uniref:TauD/TfdA dioxygenase family protein n=1 Tax=Saccharopolyspora sp. TaxID=33915 RepID=UPI0025E3B5C1|nr:TauD/TfdA family dioxygenase [Saccharopolyspora sp.]MBQ6641546.1 TauD/TfdA family dioxygenase [Saccharopolyspora sp.]
MTNENLKSDVLRVAGRIGAEITGVQLADRLSEETVAHIRNALLQHKVVFFRGQHGLTDDEQVEFAARLGTVTTAHPTVPGEEHAAHVLPLDADRGARANSWHTDVTFVENPPAFSVLRAVTVPPYGGDTVWANTVAAYEGLTPELQELAGRLRALHSNAYDYAAKRPNPTDAEQERHKQFVSTVYETEHPVVRVHPETGERSLLLGHFVQRFLGFGKSDTARLFDLLQSHVTQLENTVGWRWAPGDVAIWDNRATQHYAVDDYGQLARKVSRVTVAGEVPVDVAGRRSVARRGDAAA